MAGERLTDAELNGALDSLDELHDYLRSGISKVECFGGESGGKFEDWADAIHLVTRERRASALTAADRDALECARDCVAETLQRVPRHRDPRTGRQYSENAEWDALNAALPVLERLMKEGT